MPHQHPHHRAARSENAIMDVHRRRADARSWREAAFEEIGTAIVGAAIELSLGVFGFAQRQRNSIFCKV